MSMRVYIAAPYSMKDIIALRAKELADHGIECTSTWVTEPHKPTIQMDELAAAQHRFYAIQDVNDVKRAHIMVFHTDPTKTLVRAGRHVEFGMAAVLNIPILVVGEERENIFHYLPFVEHFPTWEAALNELIDRDNCPF
jgi:nucleoside 2-deoxyribosyltransferase